MLWISVGVKQDISGVPLDGLLADSNGMYSSGVDFMQCAYSNEANLSLCLLLGSD